MDNFSDFKSYIIAFIISLLFVLLSIFAPINNKFLESIFEFLIVLPWIYKVIKMEPKLYLKTFSMRKININHQITVKILNCEITKDLYKKLEDHMLSMNKSDSTSYRDRVNKSISDRDGNYFITEFVLDSTPVTLRYDLESRRLSLMSESSTAYKAFLIFSDKLLNQINRFFQSNKDIEYCDENDLSIQVTIEFRDESNETSVSYINPLWQKIFGSFDIKWVKLNYLGKYNSIISITNSNINITNNNIENIGKDIRGELSFEKVK